MYKNNKIKGFTLIELMIGIGLISVSSVAIYSVASITNDYRKSSSEVKSLSQVIKNVDLNIGSFSHVTISSLSFNSSLNLKDLKTDNDKLTFIYDDVNTRICNDFASKMVSGNRNISLNINNTDISKNKLKEISNTCVLSHNKMMVVLNKELSDYSLNTVVASANLPPAPPPDIAIPDMPIPQALPVVNGFIPSTANPVTYPITTDTPPIPPITIGGGGITVNSPSSVVPVYPSVPNWTPPVVVRPPAPPAPPPDTIDQDPNPPAPPPKQSFYNKVIEICQSGYTFDNGIYSCKSGNNPTIRVTLTLDNPALDDGIPNFIIPPQYQPCNTGESGYAFDYFKYRNQVDDTYFYRMNTRMHINAFNNMKTIIFTCLQNG